MKSLISSQKNTRSDQNYYQHQIILVQIKWQQRFQTFKQKNTNIH
jgi:hypothetical protein